MSRSSSDSGSGCNWLWVIIAIVGLVFVQANCSNYFNGVTSSGGDAEDYYEGLNESHSYNDPGDRYTPERTFEEFPIPDDYTSSDTVSSSSSAGCPYGCDYHETGCDIKGNISVSTQEKIYHIPGGAYYAKTEIDPNYGEVWFCTEAEAIANGWRKSAR